jgi:hypothetical protein
MPEIDDWIHPLDAIAQRDPLTNAAVRVIALHLDQESNAEAVGRGLVKLVQQRGREADLVVASVQPSWSQAIQNGLAGGSQPIVIVTSAIKAWSLAHLDPLLAAIDTKDHVIGRRPLPLPARGARWLRHLPGRLLFANPVVDPQSPCWVHRRAAIESISLQSLSRFARLELLAKATYLKQLVDEVDIPALDAIADHRPTNADFRAVWSNPTFRPLTST